MGLNGHDIRMKEFRRAALRGYSTKDVDEFLTDVAVALDQRDDHRRPPAHAATRVGTGRTPRPVESVPPPSRRAAGTGPAIGEGLDRSGSDEDAARAEAERAVRIVSTAQASAAALERRARQTAEEAIRDARAHAERGLRKARERAEEILRDAHDRHQRAARLEAEAELRLAHVEQGLARKVSILAEEAKRLDALAAWLAQDDLGAAPPAHAAPAAPLPDDVSAVVPFKRSADPDH